MHWLIGADEGRPKPDKKQKQNTRKKILLIFRGVLDTVNMVLK